MHQNHQFHQSSLSAHGEPLSFDPEVFFRHPALGGRRSAGPKGRMNPRP
jgi:hypothetical protein